MLSTFAHRVERSSELNSNMHYTHTHIHPLTSDDYRRSTSNGNKIKYLNGENDGKQDESTVQESKNKKIKENRQLQQQRTERKHLLAFYRKKTMTMMTTATTNKNISVAQSLQ